MSLPRRLDWTLAQDRWASQLEPIIAAPSNNSSILKSVNLVAGNNTINHGLGRVLQGWTIVRLRGLSTIWDAQDSNPTPAQTLVLVASSPVSADIEVF
jgi:hypothetical protein